MNGIIPHDLRLRITGVRVSVVRDLQRHKVHLRFDNELIEQLGWQAGDRISAKLGSDNLAGYLRLVKVQRHPEPGIKLLNMASKPGAVRISLFLPVWSGLPGHTSPTEKAPHSIDGLGLIIKLPEWRTGLARQEAAIRPPVINDTKPQTGIAPPEKGGNATWDQKMKGYQFSDHPKAVRNAYL